MTWTQPSCTDLWRGSCDRLPVHWKPIFCQNCHRSLDGRSWVKTASSLQDTSLWPCQFLDHDGSCWGGCFCLLKYILLWISASGKNWEETVETAVSSCPLWNNVTNHSSFLFVSVRREYFASTAQSYTWAHVWCLEQERAESSLTMQLPFISPCREPSLFHSALFIIFPVTTFQVSWVSVYDPFFKRTFPCSEEKIAYRRFAVKQTRLSMTNVKNKIRTALTTILKLSSTLVCKSNLNNGCGR